MSMMSLSVKSFSFELDVVALDPTGGRDVLTLGVKEGWEEGADNLIPATDFFKPVMMILDDADDADDVVLLLSGDDVCASSSWNEESPRDDDGGMDKLW